MARPRSDSWLSIAGAIPGLGSRLGLVAQDGTLGPRSQGVQFKFFMRQIAVLLRERARLFSRLFNGDHAAWQNLVHKMCRSNHFRKGRILRQNMEDVSVFRQIAEDMSVKSGDELFPFVLRRTG